MKDTRYVQIVKTSLIGIVGNLLLTLMKVIVGLLAGSIAIVLDAVNSLTDAAASIVTIIGAKIAGLRPTRKHPFGYGRVEYLTSGIIAAIVLGAGVISLYESVLKIITPSPPDYAWYTLVVLIVAIVVKVIMGFAFIRKGNAIKSQPLAASGIDALYDAVLTAGTLAAALICMIWDIDLDGWVGAIISAFIIKGGLDILGSAVSPILGERPDAERVHELESVIASHDGVLGVYDLFIDDFGPESSLAAAHIEVLDDMRASEIHELTRHISEEVYERFRIAITLGVYATNSAGQYSFIRDFLMAETAKHPEILEVHGFYVARRGKCVDFDLVIDFHTDAEQVKNSIIEAMEEEFPSYSFNVITDVDYSVKDA